MSSPLLYNQKLVGSKSQPTLFLQLLKAYIGLIYTRKLPS